MRSVQCVAQSVCVTGGGLANYNLTTITLSGSLVYCLELCEEQLV